MEEISQLQSDILEEHMVFLAYVNKPDKVRSIQPSTVAKIIQKKRPYKELESIHKHMDYTFFDPYQAQKLSN